MHYPPLRPEQRLWRWFRSLYPISQLGLGCLTLLIVFFVCSICAGAWPAFRDGVVRGYERNQPPPIVDTPTANGTPAQEWITTNTFTGSGSSHTGTFTVSGDWQINWYCTLPSDSMTQANIRIDVNRPGQKVSLVPFAVDEFCSTSVYSGATEERQTGTLYLAVTSNTSWTIEIEQLQ